jgi:hypothetical protein
MGHRETNRRPRPVAQEDTEMATWGDLERRAPRLAARGKALLYRSGEGEALLVTVRGERQPPQAHPIYVRVVAEGLYAFVLPSPKLQDLLADGRYALHAHFDPAAPNEFLVNGRVRAVDSETRDRLAADWGFPPGDAPAFEFLIDEALYAERPTADDWPPRYETWRASSS